MKHINLIIIALLFTGSVCLAQVKKHSIIGVWQVGTAQMADAWLANYRFYKNGTFKYTLNEYDDLSRIRQAKGTFKLKGDTLTLIIKSRIEEVGGDLVQGSPGFQAEELVLDDTKTVAVKQKNVEPIHFVLEWHTGKSSISFQIQNNRYYIVSRDPNFEDN
jgi:hypothetical protein